MKRDMELVRKILLNLEDHGTAYGFEGPHPTDEEVDYHLCLMEEGGIVHCNYRAMGGSSFRLTWEGHEFLDAARDESRWTEAKRKVGQRLELIPFDILKSLLLDLIKRSIG